MTSRPNTAGPAPVDETQWRLARLHVARYCREQHPGRSRGARLARRALWLRLVEMLGIGGDQAAGYRAVNVTTGEGGPDAQMTPRRAKAVRA